MTRPIRFVKAEANDNIRDKLEDGISQDLVMSKELAKQITRMSLLTDKFVQVHDTVMLQEQVSTNNR